MRIAALLAGVLGLLSPGNPAFSQQLKLGLNPYTVQKSALLELNSTNQGLLLARITDTSLINTLSPPDGMVIFFTPTKQLMVRSNGAWQAFIAVGGAITGLNGLTAPVQTFATGTSGTDFGISSTGTVHTFNLPDASATTRGVVTTGTQTFAGSKTFSSAPTFLSLTTGSVSDSLLTITNGLVRKISSTGNFWALGGNTVGSSKNFGTVDAFDLPFITANTERMRLSSAGSLGLGASTFDGTAPEKLLISAGATSSYNLLVAKGSRNGYLQFNIQNQSSQGQASTDIVVTADNGTSKSSNYVNLGINGSNYNNGSGSLLGTANTVYLYSAAQDFVIGNSAASKNLIFFTGGSATSNEAMRINGSGDVGVGISSPTARLHLPAGTATANTAPLKLTSGTNLTTPENGAVEYDGTNYFVTQGTTRFTLAKTLTAAAALDFPSTGGTSASTLTISVPGAVDGDPVSLGVPNAAASIGGANFSAYVSSAGVVTIKLYNSNVVTAVDPASGTYRVSVLRY
jgi:hypothetical protein